MTEEDPGYADRSLYVSPYILDVMTHQEAVELAKSIKATPWLWEAFRQSLITEELWTWRKIYHPYMQKREPRLDVFGYVSLQLTLFDLLDQEAESDAASLPREVFEKLHPKFKSKPR